MTGSHAMPDYHPTLARLGVEQRKYDVVLTTNAPNVVIRKSIFQGDRLDQGSGVRQIRHGGDTQSNVCSKSVGYSPTLMPILPVPG